MKDLATDVHDAPQFLSHFLANLVIDGAVADGSLKKRVRKALLHQLLLAAGGNHDCCCCCCSWRGRAQALPWQFTAMPSLKPRAATRTWPAPGLTLAKSPLITSAAVSTAGLSPCRCRCTAAPLPSLPGDINSFLLDLDAMDAQHLDHEGEGPGPLAQCCL